MLSKWRRYVASPSLLIATKWAIECVKNLFDAKFAFMDSKWLPHGGVSLWKANSLVISMWRIKIQSLR